MEKETKYYRCRYYMTDGTLKDEVFIDTSILNALEYGRNTCKKHPKEYQYVTFVQEYDTFEAALYDDKKPEKTNCNE